MTYHTLACKLFYVDILSRGVLKSLDEDIHVLCTEYRTIGHTNYCEYCLCDTILDDTNYRLLKAMALSDCCIAALSQEVDIGIIIEAGRDSAIPATHEYRFHRLMLDWLVFSTGKTIEQIVDVIDALEQETIIDQD